jgi:hypothetical protein
VGALSAPLTRDEVRSGSAIGKDSV